MGLAVAWQLCLDGHRPVVFEADDRVGGMTACFDFGELRIERFYHFHCISDQGFLTLLDELGLAGRMRWKATRMGYYFQQAVQPWGNPIALLQFRGASLLAKLRYGVHAFACTRRDDWKPLDRLEATSWIRRWVGAEAWEVFWRRLFDYKFYDYADQLSAAWIWSRIRRIGRSRSNLFKEKLGYLEGGSDVFLETLSGAIRERGGEIRLGHRVIRIPQENGQVTGLEVLQPDGSRPFEPFERVISTMPLPFVPQVVPDLPAQVLAAYRNLRSVAVVCVIVRLRRPLSDNFWLNVNDPGMDIPGLVEYSNLRPLKQHVVYVPFYIPGDHPGYRDGDEVFCDKVRRYLLQINPTLKPEDLIEVRASRYRYAQPVCGPGFLDSLPPMKTAIDGLWVADTSHYYPEDRGISESIDLGRRLARLAVA